MALEVPLSTSAVTSLCLPGVISRKHALQKPQQDSLYTILVLNLYESTGNRANGYQGVRALWLSPPPLIRLYFYNHAVKHVLVLESQCVNFVCCSKVTTLASKHQAASCTAWLCLLPPVFGHSGHRHQTGKTAQSSHTYAADKLHPMPHKLSLSYSGWVCA